MNMIPVGFVVLQNGTTGLVGLVHPPSLATGVKRCSILGPHDSHYWPENGVNYWCPGQRSSSNS